MISCSLRVSLQVFVAFDNHRPPAALRSVRFFVGFHYADDIFPELDWCATVPLTVLPMNDAVRWPSSPVIAIDENSAPQMTLTVTLDCGAAALSLASVARSADLCLTEGDPIFAAIMNDGPEAGISSAAPQAAQIISSYTLVLTGYTTDARSGSPLACPLTLVPVSDAIWDCTFYGGSSLSLDSLAVETPPANAVPLVPCWRVTYNLSSGPFDFENPYCPRMSYLDVIVVDTLRIIDVNGTESSQVVQATGSFNLSIVNVLEPPYIQWAPNLDADHEVLMDQREDINGLAAGQPPTLFFVFDQDVPNVSNINVSILGVFPTDRDQSLLGGLPTSDILKPGRWGRRHLIPQLGHGFLRGPCWSKQGFTFPIFPQHTSRLG